MNNFKPLVFLLIFMLLDSIITVMTENTETYVYVPIAALSFIGLLILIKDEKKANNYKKSLSCSKGFLTYLLIPQLHSILNSSLINFTRRNTSNFL